MQDPSAISGEGGVGLGTLTVYTGLVLYYFVVIPSELVYIRLVLVFSVAPAVVVNEVSKTFTDDIIKQTLEQHIAIARVQTELAVGGSFEDWYQNEAKEEIDNHDAKSQQKVTTVLCSILIGISAPIFGYLLLDVVGLASGLVVTVLALLLIIHSFREIVRMIERTPKVINA